MAYLKSWAPRSYNELALRLPEPVAGPAGSVSRLDANVLAPDLDVDLVYIDPPYNQHSFFSNYHVWETLVRWDAPESYGVANKRVDCREQPERLQLQAAARPPRSRSCWRRSGRRGCWSRSRTRGFTMPARSPSSFPGIGYVGRIDVDSKRYVGAQIGIYNPSGEKVGTVSRLRNREILLIAGPDRLLVEEVGGRRAPPPGRR